MQWESAWRSWYRNPGVLVVFVWINNRVRSYREFIFKEIIGSKNFVLNKLRYFTKVIMKANNPQLIIWLLSFNCEEFTSINLKDWPISVERLKRCDWSPRKFTEVIFSQLTESNQIFRIDFVIIHYHFCEISCHIIECKIFWSVWTLYN